MGNKHNFHRLPPSFDGKWTSLKRKKWALNCLFPRRHFIHKHNDVFSVIGKIKKFRSRKTQKIYDLSFNYGKG